MEEAFRYHTVVSLHINLTDSYTDSPLWQKYLDRGLIARREDGTLFDIGVWGGKTSYQIDYKAEWESGCLQARVQRLIELLPVQKAGTIHIDAYLCRTFAGTTLEEQRCYRRKAIRYFRALGIDVTSEFLYDCPGRDQGVLSPGTEELQRDDLIGLVPMAWWLNQRKECYLTRPASLLCGGRYNPDLDPKRSDTLGFLTGNSVHGESGFRFYRDADSLKWQRCFLSEFILDGVFWYWQNRMRLLSFEGAGEEIKAVYENGYCVQAKNHVICQGERVFRQEGDVLAPILWQGNEYLAYSSDGYMNRAWKWDGGNIHACFSLEESGWVPANDRYRLQDGQLILSMKPGEVLLFQNDLS